MKEKVGVILASAMLVAGCDSVHADHGLEYVSSGPPKVDTHAVAEVLPGAVAEQIPNVVTIRRMSQLGLANYCSGIRINEYEYLSAGHCNQPPETDPPTAEECVDYTITVADDGSDEVPAFTISDSYNPSKNFHDAMLLHTEAVSPPYEVPVHVTDPANVAPGTPLYVVNFEPTNGNDYLGRPGQDQPTVLAAVSLGAQRDNGQIEALVGIKSYSPDGETMIRGGASGGPVFDANGNLVGVVASTEKYRDLPNTVLTYESKDDVDITDLPDNAPVNVMRFEPITAQTVAGLQANLQVSALPQC